MKKINKLIKKVNRKDINPVKMSVNPPKEIVNAGHRIINTDGFIYEYVGIGWVKCEKATPKDFKHIPQLFD